jgi:hypothetical protein
LEVFEVDIFLFVVVGTAVAVDDVKDVLLFNISDKLDAVL